jgi:hypothetical protein
MTRLELRHQLLVHARQHARLGDRDDRVGRHAGFDHGLVRVRKDLVVDDLVDVARAKALDDGARGFEFLCVRWGDAVRAERERGLTSAVDASTLLRRSSVR